MLPLSRPCGLAIALSLFAVSVSAQSTDVDKKLGAQAAADVLRTRGLYEDPRLTSFFEKLGARLVEKLGPQPFTYRFAVSDEVEPNAYALPAGFVFATRNIFAVANSEAEIAGIVGHEIIHAHKRHAVKATKRSILPAILAVPGGLAGVFSEQAGQVLSAPSSLAMAKHSRKYETEADDLGVQLSAAAGYDPLALQKCLKRLTSTVELFMGEKEKASYFDDHPSTPDRAARIEKIAAAAPRGSDPPLLPNREAYLKLLDGLIVGKDPAQGVFEKSAFLHPGFNFRMDLPEGWKTLNTPSAFGAIEPKGKGMLVVGLVEGPLDPEKAAQQTITAIEKNARKKPAETRSLQVNSHPGYYALYAQKKSNLHLLWVVMGGKLFRMAGVGEDQWKQSLRDSALSLRPLPTADRASIRVLRLRLDSPRAGESLDAFCKRTNNAFKPELTAVLNDLDGQTLKPGQLLKIARWEPYKAKP
jgi:predicted Zn-dependent protease